MFRFQLSRTELRTDTLILESSMIDLPKLCWKEAMIGVSTAQFVFQSYLKYRQLRSISKPKPIPANTIVEVNDNTALNQAKKYARSIYTLELVNVLRSLVRDIAYFKYDIYPRLWKYSGDLIPSLAQFLPKFLIGPVTHNLMFLGCYSFLEFIPDLIVSSLTRFIQKKYRKSEITDSEWLFSHLVTKPLMTVVGKGVVTMVLMKLINLVWCNKLAIAAGVLVFSSVTFVHVYYPVKEVSRVDQIQNFFDFTNENLRSKIEILALKLGFPLNDIMIVQYSKSLIDQEPQRKYNVSLTSSKINGLFDILVSETLVDNNNSDDELIGFIASTVGYWKVSNSKRNYVFTVFKKLSELFMFNKFIASNSLYQDLGFGSEKPIGFGLLMFYNIWSYLIDIGFLSFIGDLFVRLDEYRTDAYLLTLGYTTELKMSLMYALNSSNSSFSSTSTESLLNSDWLHEVSTNEPDFSGRLLYIDEIKERSTSL